MSTKRWYDISVDVSPNMVVWPNSQIVNFEKSWDMDNGDIATDTTIKMSVHTGTHIDAPSHFIASGKTVEKIPLETLLGEAYVVEFKGNSSCITAKDLDELCLPENIKRLLFKTANSHLWSDGIESFYHDFVALTSDAAEWIAEREIKLVGIDYLSIQKYDDSPETHQILLGQEVVILEGLNLSEIDEGFYEFFCLPLKLRGIEASPCRVLLRDL